MLTAFLTHNPEDLRAYYGRALPELKSIAAVVGNPLDRDLNTPELVAAAKDCDVIIAHRSTPGANIRNCRTSDDADRRPSRRPHRRTPDPIANAP